MTSYSRETPSPEYLDMVAMYETLPAPGIAAMIDRTGAAALFDGGAGS